MPAPARAIPAGILHLPERRRSEFFQMVGVWTTGGVVISLLCAIGAAWVIHEVPILQYRLVQLVLMFGCIGLSGSVATPMVRHNQSQPAFVMGSAAMGVALGYILAIAVAVGADVFGTEDFAHLTLIAQAGGLTGATALSLGAYLSLGPKDLSMVRGFLAVTCAPMFMLMVLTAVHPIGGTLGILISLLFVAVSALSLLSSLHRVLHEARAGQEIYVAYELSQSLIVLFWNLTVLLIRLYRRA